MTKPKQTLWQTAEAHWEYNKGVLIILDPSLIDANKRYLDLMRNFYIQAFIHGRKHGKEEK